MFRHANAESLNLHTRCDSCRRRVMAERELTEPVKTAVYRSNDGRNLKTRVTLHPDDPRTSLSLELGES